MIAPAEIHEPIPEFDIPYCKKFSEDYPQLELL